MTVLGRCEGVVLVLQVILEPAPTASKIASVTVMDPAGVFKPCSIHDAPLPSCWWPEHLLPLSVAALDEEVASKGRCPFPVSRCWSGLCAAGQGRSHVLGKAARRSAVPLRVQRYWVAAGACVSGC